ncbi:acyl carrier protein [Streptomyces boncukensis]|uniref:Acyl carrier protein n=1 Tax=Streptomyces boncukensis TaxID=2711219 RepID=A0A6G4WWF8_9ACTN|nr:acyl carrier protein [Streptomyces boncukensis]NGO68937.1 acyl carrier protein [Streptomyces boncukensis]
MSVTSVPQQRAPSPARLLALDTAERTRAIEEFVAQELAGLLQVPPAHRMNTGRPLRTQGVGSILGLHLKRLLEVSFGVDVGAVSALCEESMAGLATTVALRLEDPSTLLPAAGRAQEGPVPGSPG